MDEWTDYDATCFLLLNFRFLLSALLVFACLQSVTKKWNTGIWMVSCHGGMVGRMIGWFVAFNGWMNGSWVGGIMDIASDQRQYRVASVSWTLTIKWAYVLVR